MSVQDISNCGVEERLAVIKRIIEHPHRYTVEDLAFAKEVWGMSVEDTIQAFMGLPRLAVVWLDGAPLYLFGVAMNGHINTLSEERLETAKVHMTKAVVRFSRTPSGAAFFDDATGVADKADIAAGDVLPAWARLIGFVPYAEHQMAGRTFVFFHRLKG